VKAPTRRESRRLKYAATINDEALPETTDPDHELQYIDIGNVDSLGKVHEVATYTFEKAPSRARRIVRDGDVIISTVRTYLQAIAPIEDPPKNLIVSTGFAVVRPRPGILDAGFCKYALRVPRFLWEVEARSVGVSYPAINSSDLCDIKIDLPPVHDQAVIARYLDREVSQIDALVAEKESMLNLLQEKQRSFTNQAVTRGLDPKVRMKPSGQAWLGDVPAHWEVRRTKRVLAERDDRSETGEEELLTVSHITGVTKRSEKEVNMFEAETMEGYKTCSPGNLVINTLWAWMGAMGISPEEGIVSPAYHVYELSDEILPAYLDALVRTPAFTKEVTRFSTGVWSSRLRLYPEGLFEVRIPVPPLAEQKKIAAAIAHERARTSDLEKELRHSINLLKDRRAALITAAVTGKISNEEITT
jgi:type I restriction enzyme, S subunit